VINGGGFKANAPITLSFDGSSVATSCTTNATGSLSPCAFTVPAAPAGTHTVTASDGTGYSASALYTVTPAFSLYPLAGAGGGTVTLSGSNYTPNSTLTVTFNGVPVSTFGLCTTDASGYLLASNNCAFTVPTTTAGSYTVTASNGTYTGSATFTVSPALSLIPSTGSGGSLAVVTGSGFTPDSTIAVTFDGRSVATTCTANANGSISSCAYTVPAVAAGIHTVTASDGTRYSASAIFTVTPAFSLNATAGIVGSTVLLSGSYYTPNSTLTVAFNGATLRTSGTCTTDASGYLLASNNCAFTVPATTAGSYTVTVSDGTYTGSATFTVIRAISLIPSAGPGGSAAAVSGSGFAPFARLALTFDGSSVPVTASGGIPCTADASGRFSFCAFTVLAAPAGRHAVTVSDGTNTGTAIFTVIPAPPAPPAPLALLAPLAPPAPPAPTQTETRTVTPAPIRTPTTTGTSTAIEAVTPPAPTSPKPKSTPTRTAARTG
jgi:flagellar basal body rod protein FlgG